MRTASFGADAGRARQAGAVPGGDGADKVARRQGGEDRQRHFGADALHGGQQAEPVALGGVGKAVEQDGVLAHMVSISSARSPAWRGRAAERAGARPAPDSRRRATSMMQLPSVPARRPCR